MLPTQTAWKSCCLKEGSWTLALKCNRVDMQSKKEQDGLETEHLDGEGGVTRSQNPKTHALRGEEEGMGHDGKGVRESSQGQETKAG